MGADENATPQLTIPLLHPKDLALSFFTITSTEANKLVMTQRKHVGDKIYGRILVPKALSPFLYF